MFLSKYKAALVAAPILGLLASAAGMMADQKATEKQAQRPEPGAVAPEAEELSRRKDAFGDPLPGGAVARLGTVRWRHGAPVHFLALPPDGKTVISAANDRLVRVWDSATGEELRRIGPGGPVESGTLAFRNPLVYDRRFTQTVAAVSKDGKLLATHFDGPVVELWDVATGKKAGAIPLGKFEVMSLAFAPSDNQLAMGSHNGVIRLWDIEAGKVVREFGKLFEQEFVGVPESGNCDVVYSPNGKTLVSLVLEAHPPKIPVVHIKFWDPETGRERHTVTVNDSGVAPPVFSPDGKFLAYAAAQTELGVINADTGEVLHKWRRSEYVSGPAYLVFSAEGAKLYSNEDGRIIREWDAKSGKELRCLSDLKAAYDKRLGPRCSLALSADGKTLVVGGGGNSLRFLDIESGKEVSPDRGHSAKVRFVGYSPDGKSLLTRDSQVLRWWELATAKQVKEMALTTNPGPPFAAYTADGRYVAGLDLKKLTSSYLRDVGSGKQVAEIPVGVSDSPWLRFAPDGHTLVIFRRGKEASDAELYEVPSGKKLCAVPLGGRVLANAEFERQAWCFFSPDGKYIGVHDLSKTVTIRDGLTGKAVLTIPPGDEPNASNAAFSPDGRTIALDQDDGRVRIIEVASAKERGVLGTKDAPRKHFSPTLNIIDDDGGVLGNAPTVAFSPDSRLLAHASFNSVDVWATATGQRVARFEGHQGPVNMLAFGPDGRSLASASSDTTALVWDVQGLSGKAGPTAQGLDDDALQTRWKELTGDDARAAADAINALVAAPHQAIPFLKGHLQPATVLEPAVIAKWVEQLDNDDFKVRQKAQADLRAAGEQVLPYLDKALAREELPLEQQQRLKSLRSKLIVTLPLTGDRLRLVRAVEVLERIGNAEARQLLGELVASARGTFASSQSDAALKRLNQKR